MTAEEKKNALHCLKAMIDEAVCEECDLYGTTGTDHCEKDCVRVAIKALEQQSCEDAISRYGVPHKIAEFFSNWDGDENSKMEISVNDMREISSMFVSNCRAESKLKALEQEPCEDAISREDALMCMTGEYVADMTYKPEDIITKHIKRLRALPSVQPKQKVGHCKDCKWWKDSDGVYRRGVGAESQCSINRREVFEGNGYCYMFEPQAESEES